MSADDHGLAAELAAGAGRVLLAVRERGGPEVGRAGDLAAQEYLAGALAAARPADPVLSEEARDDPRRLAVDRVWIVDPLDGTREFAEAGREDWAVHVALWQDGDLTAGAVALPAVGEVLSTAVPLPARPAAQPPRMVVSRSRAPEFVTDLAQRLGAELLRLGSAGAKTAAVIAGTADAYVHAGGINEWDSAAPVAVARAAGLHTSRLDGSAIRFNEPDPLQEDLLICRPELAAPILAAIRQL